MTLALVIPLALAACAGGEATEDATTTVAPSATTSSLPAETTTAGAGPATDVPELPGSSWTVTHHASELYPDVTNVWSDSELTIEFAGDGTVSGSTGCNEFRGSYEVSGPYVTESDGTNQLGQALAITDLSWTERACESQNLMDQEAEYLDALSRVERWVIGQGFGSDDDLLLLSIEDGLMVEATR